MTSQWISAKFSRGQALLLNGPATELGTVLLPTT
jgi:hypothetical protein